MSIVELLNAYSYRAAACAILIAMSASVHAQLFCDRPNKPTCIGVLAISRDELTFQACRDEVETYRLRMLSYLDCLRVENDSAANELKKEIDHFNECAHSEFCF